MILAPTTVAVCLLALHDVWATFLCYHVLICLGIPLADSLVHRKRTFTGHLAYLGLAGPHWRRGVAAGLLLGLGSGGAVVGGFALWGEELLAGNRILEILADWGAGRERLFAMSVFLILGNGLAEELFWRGYLHRLLETVRRRWLAIGLPAACFASYHVATISRFVDSAATAGLFLGTVLGAGILWGWLRERTGSVWPALLGHNGATAGYVVVFWNWVID